jgi:hypothetical protein
MPAALDPDELRARQLLAIAAEVSGHGGLARARWAHAKAGVTYNDNAFNNAINPHRGVGRAIRRTLVVAPELLGLVPYLMRVDGQSRSAPDIIEAVSGLAGVCAVVELDSQLDLLIFCLVEDDDEANRLREAVRARAPERGVSKERIARIVREPEINTWEHLAMRQVGRLGGKPVGSDRAAQGGRPPR